MRFPLVTALLFAGAVSAFGQFQVNLSFGRAPYYGYPQRDIVYVQQYVPAYDVPRVFLFSRYARISPSVVVGMYRGGYGWDYMCTRYRVPRDRFYGVPEQRYYDRSYGPSYAPYGRGNGFYDRRDYDRRYREHEYRERRHERRERSYRD